MSTEEEGAGVDVHRPVPTTRFLFEGRPVVAGGGVVDEDVEAAKVVFDFLVEVGYFVEVADVGLDDMGAAAEGTDGVSGFFGRFAVA